MEGPPSGGARHADLICFELQADEARLRALRACLVEEELARAARFVFPELGRRFILARGRLRELLAQRLGVAPCAIRFRYGPHGKPELDGSLRDAGLHFNLSHCGDRALAGFCVGRRIGVDIEEWRALRDETALARRNFAPGELADYLSLPASLRTEGFFNGWSRKEAFIKAVGRGLSLPLRSFEVSLRPGDEPQLRSWDSREGGLGPWSLAAPRVPGPCAAAVIVEAARSRISAVSCHEATLPCANRA